MTDDDRAIRLKLSTEEWRQLRIRAAERGVSMTVYATEVVRADLHAGQRKRPKKSD